MPPKTSYDDVIRIIRHLPALVAAKRYRDHISLREAERQSGVSFSTIQRFETLGSKVHVDTLLALLEWLKTGEER